jgi:SAM-dependent methyltransferase
MNCRHCTSPLTNVFLDLGFAPPSNAYLDQSGLKKPEKHYPLKLYTCTTCWLVQTEDYAEAEELFNADYAYFSSTSKSWLEHASKYASRVTRSLSLNSTSLVIEVASNDGYLLKNFVEQGIPCIGIEPTAGTAAAAEALNIPVIRKFFCVELAKQLKSQGKTADLVVGNNVLAHVPNINDFVTALSIVLKQNGVITLEFPHLMNLLEYNQFDTIYHEHFSYLSLSTVRRILKSARLDVYDVEQLPTHGGSLRVYACHQSESRPNSAAVEQVLKEEAKRGMLELSGYQKIQKSTNSIKNNIVEFLIKKHREGKKIVGYGAAAKGCTMINYAGIKADLLPLVCDNATSKQGKYLPGSHIPITTPEVIGQLKPDYIWILPWNIKSEVMSQLSYVREWGGQFVVAVPQLETIP